MDFEFEPMTLIIAAVFYLVILAGIWKFTIGTGWSLPNKIILTVLSAPMCYLIVNWQVNR